VYVKNKSIKLIFFLIFLNGDGLWHTKNVAKSYPQSIHIKQYKFIKQEHNNKFIKEFMLQSRLIQFNDGVLG